jgi:hypothetical protein
LHKGEECVNDYAITRKAIEKKLKIAHVETVTNPRRAIYERSGTPPSSS